MLPLNGQLRPLQRSKSNIKTFNFLLKSQLWINYMSVIPRIALAISKQHWLWALQVWIYFKTCSLAELAYLKMFTNSNQEYLFVFSRFAAQFWSCLCPYLTSELCYCYLRLTLTSLTFWGSSDNFYMSTPL